jgi:anti-anti-sigma factor
MQFKLDTKEKFHVIRLDENDLTANLSEEITKTITNCLNTSIKNIIINMGEVNNIAPQILSLLIELQQKSLENGHSFVFCNFSTQVKTYLKDQDLLDEIQYTPTENEAIEIVHMDEIEREMWDWA